MFKPDLLRSFIAVIDARSFTTAARQLNSTQSTISQKIMRLEEAAGAIRRDKTEGIIRAADIMTTDLPSIASTTPAAALIPLLADGGAGSGR